MNNLFTTYNRIIGNDIGEFTNLSSIVEYIKNSNDIINDCRQEYIIYGKSEKYKQIKLQLKNIVWSWLIDGKRCDNNCLYPTNFICFDLDDKEFDIDSIEKSKIFFAYRSISNTGYHIVVNAIGYNKNNYHDFYNDCATWLGINKTYDKNTNKISQCFVLGNDSNYILNCNSEQYIRLIKESGTYTPKVTVSTNKKDVTNGVYINPTVTPKVTVNKLFYSNRYLYQPGYYPYGIPVIELKLHKMKEGKRNQGLYMAAVYLKKLNVDVTEERLYQELTFINKNLCDPNLPEKEVFYIVRSAMNTTPDEKRMVKTRHTIFDPDKKLSKSEKCSIIGKNRTEGKKQIIYDLIVNWDFTNDKKITISKIAEKLKVVRTRLNVDYGSFIKQTIKEVW